MRHGFAGVVALLVLLAGSTFGAQSVDRRTGGGAALAALGSSFSGRVVSVADGDTLDVMTKDNRRVRIRLEGIDSPERGTPFSNVARNFTRGLAFDKTVQVKVHDVDRYGRLVARVTSEGKDLSLELVGAGLAAHYTVFSFDPKLEAAQKEAKEARRGMWKDGLPASPTRASGSSPAQRAVATPAAQTPSSATSTAACITPTRVATRGARTARAASPRRRMRRRRAFGRPGIV